MDRYLIGMDGGGTKTRVVIRRAGEDALLFDRLYDATNYQSIGEAATAEIFSGMMADIRAALGGCTSASALAAGMAGVDRPQDAEVYRRILHDVGYTGTAGVYNDMDTALAGAHGGKDGMYLNCGTGSIAVGRWEGKMVRAGGWGSLFGDEGSGYALGLEAVKAVFRAYDRTGEQTELTRAVLKKLGLGSVPDLLDIAMEGEGRHVSLIASLAPEVTTRCEHDPVCRYIARTQTDMAAELVAGVARQLGREDLPLALGGSLLIKSAPYRALFLQALESRLPRVTVTEPVMDPAQGALCLAQRLLEEGSV